MSTVLNRLKWAGRRYEVPPILRNRVPYKLAWAGLNGAAATFPAFGGGSFLAGFTAPQNAPAGTPFLVRSLIYEDSTDTTALANWNVRMDQNSQRDFMNGPVHIRTLAGTAQTPGVLVEPILMDSRTRVNTTIAMSDGPVAAPSTGRLYLDGMLLLPNDGETVRAIARWKARQSITYPFWYVYPTPITAAGSYDIKIGDSHFELHRLNAVGIASGGAEAEFDFQLTNATTGELLMNGSTTKVNGFGDGNFPGHLPSPLLIEKGSIIRLTIGANGTDTDNMWPVLVGRKIIAPLRKWQSILAETNDLLEMMS